MTKRAMSITPRAYTRRQVLADVKAVKKGVSWLQDQWTVTGTVHDFDSRDDHGNVPTRPRRADEYPENQAQAWRELADYAGQLADALERIQRTARAMADLGDAPADGMSR